MHRRPKSARLAWPSAGPGTIYGVSVRNLDTDERAAIYDGASTTCRLPAAFRASSGSLVYRVQAQTPNDRAARVLVPPTAIDRIGDDFDTPAPDLLVGEPVEGAADYRLVVRDAATSAKVMEFRRAEPRFLLPVGALADIEAVWAIVPGEASAKRATWTPVTPDMVAAAVARRDRPIDAGDDVVVAEMPVLVRATVPPGVAANLAPMAETGRRSLLLPIVPLRLRPDLALAHDPDGLIEEQWGAESAVASLLSTLKSRDLPALAVVDSLAIAALGAERVRPYLDRIAADGRRLGALIDPDAWAPPGEADSAAGLVETCLAAHERIVGEAPAWAALGPSAAGEEALKACEAAGVGTVVVGPDAQALLPDWMQARQTAFAVGERLVVVPVSTVITTPAHPRDRALRYVFEPRRALMTALAAAVAAAVEAGRAGPTLLAVAIDPFDIGEMVRLKDADRARVWNQGIQRSLPAWLEGGWERSEAGFDIIRGASAAGLEMVSTFLDGIVTAGVRGGGPDALRMESWRRAFCERARGFEPTVDVRRGVRSARATAVRSYDAAFRQALEVTAG